MNIAVDYQMVYENLGRTDQEFSEALKKWKQHFCSVVYRLSKVTGKDKDDLSQHILMELVRVRDTYRVPLYRFDGRLWEAEIIDGSTYYLVKPRHNKLPMEPLWVGQQLIEPVKKGKLSSVVYREITQQYSDIIAAHFCVRYGFEKIKEKGKKLVTVRSGKKGTKLEKKKITKINKFVEEVSLWDPVVADSDMIIMDIIKSPGLNPEEGVILGELLGLVCKEKKYPVHDPNA